MYIYMYVSSLYFHKIGNVSPKTFRETVIILNFLKELAKLERDSKDSVILFSLRNNLSMQRDQPLRRGR